MPRGRPFAKGYDPRRHVLSKEELRKGYSNAPQRIKVRIRGMYRGGKVVTKGPGAFVPESGMPY